MLRMAENEKAQRNWGYDANVIASFEAFCDSRLLSRAKAASAALLAFVEMSADDRDAAMERLATLQRSGKRTKIIYEDQPTEHPVKSGSGRSRKVGRD